MIGTTSPIRASLPRSGRLEAVLDPALHCLDVTVQEPDVGVGGDQESGGESPFSPFEAARVEAVVDPGERPVARVLVERLELPVGGPEAGSPVEGQVGEL